MRHLGLMIRILRPRVRTPDANAADRLRRLRSTISRAYDEVPFYRALYDGAGVKPSDIRGLKDLERFPPATKTALRAARREELVSRRFDPSALVVTRTSGSTGIPIDIYQSPAENFLFHLIKFRALRAMGLGWRDRTVRLRNRVYSRPPVSWRILQEMGFLRQENMDPDEPGDLVAGLRGLRADVMTGYTGSLARISRKLAGDPDRTLYPRFVVGGAETMTPFFRSEIREGFGCPVLDNYLCTEVGLIAWECPASGLYHVVDDALIVEVLKDGAACGPGEEGEIVVTSLVSRAMPFIRYWLGDSVKIAKEACPCGRPGTTFERILGKTQDFFWLPDGREINPWFVSGHWMDGASWIRQFEVVQDSPVSMVIRIVADGSPPASELADFTARSRTVLGPGVEFRVEFVPEIPPGPGGKVRFHRSLVRSIYDNPLDRGWLGS